MMAEQQAQELTEWVKDTVRLTWAALDRQGRGPGRD